MSTPGPLVLQPLSADQIPEETSTKAAEPSIQPAPQAPAPSIFSELSHFLHSLRSYFRHLANTLVRRIPQGIIAVGITLLGFALLAGTGALSIGFTWPLLLGLGIGFCAIGVTVLGLEYAMRYTQQQISSLENLVPRSTSSYAKLSTGNEGLQPAASESEEEDADPGLQVSLPPAIKPQSPTPVRIHSSSPIAPPSSDPAERRAISQLELATPPLPVPLISPASKV